MRFLLSNVNTQFKVACFPNACVHMVNYVSTGKVLALVFDVLQGRPVSTHKRLVLLQGEYVALNLENQGSTLAKVAGILSR